MTPGSGIIEAVAGGTDPAAVREAADRAATLLVRGARETDDAAVADRLLHLADTEGIETIAEVWSGSPADSLAGCLWRLYLLRSWVYAEPVAVARAFEAGRARAQVARVVAGCGGMARGASGAGRPPIIVDAERGTMAWRVVVDFDLCESNAVCMGVAPEVFEVRDDDFLYILDETPSDALRPKVEEAVARCPKQAISIAED